MKGKANIIRNIGMAKLLSVVMMVACLAFLTSINYFLYPSQKETSAVVDGKNSKNSIPPSGPTEEKSSSSGVSMLEEFLHDPHPIINFALEEEVHLHAMKDASRILVYHGELLSPPPEV